MKKCYFQPRISPSPSNRKSPGNQHRRWCSSMFIRWIALPPVAPHAKLCRMLSSKAAHNGKRMGNLRWKPFRTNGKTHGKPYETVNICKGNINELLKLYPLTFEHATKISANLHFLSEYSWISIVMKFLEESPEVAAERI